MTDNSKWSRRAKWLLSCIIVVVSTAAISYVSLCVTDTVKVAEEIESNSHSPVESKVSGQPDREVDDLTVERSVVFDLLKINGYGPTGRDIPDIPSGCDSETFTKLLNESIEGTFNGDKVILNLDHQDVRYLPSPSVVWLNDNGSTHPVIFLYIDNDTVTVSDTTRGMVKYPMEEFDRIYRDAGSQSVFISDRGYVIK